VRLAVAAPKTVIKSQCQHQLQRAALATSSRGIAGGMSKNKAKGAVPLGMTSHIEDDQQLVRP